jgi:hypothetical protein
MLNRIKLQVCCEGTKRSLQCHGGASKTVSDHQGLEHGDMAAHRKRTRRKRVGKMREGIEVAGRELWEAA